MNGTQEKWADRINKMLAQADGTDNVDEKQTFIAAAQRLMTQYAINEQMLAATRSEVAEEIVTDTLDFLGIFQKTTMEHVFDLAAVNNCRAFFSERHIEVEGRKRPVKTMRVTVAGYASDVERVKLLSASIDTQRASAFAQWWGAHESKQFMSKMDQYKDRREYLAGFNQGVASKLRAAYQEGKKDAVRDEQRRTKSDSKDANESVELVLRSRKDNVDDWVDQKYGKLRASHSRRQLGSMSARGAGVRAGKQANVGTPGVGGSRSALNG